ncbi:hypothetical protein EK21DRAFT_85633 [Setomelanomma holmii]|uniref:Uncharacterized protein n=1 Tax=Setomelanomma holmii TaxID=210430 RepID=A0A9P4HH61_9PLEO|nr:hypothetical protein EK21DRAFT_85633 [Setomelanomma holmii]
MDDNLDDLENDVQSPLLRHNKDHPASLSQHHNPLVRIPARASAQLASSAQNAWQSALTLIHGLGQSAIAIVEVFWHGITASPTVLWRNRWLMPIFAIIIVAGTLLVLQGSRGELNILLILLFAWGMVAFAIGARLRNLPNNPSSNA